MHIDSRNGRGLYRSYRSGRGRCQPAGMASVWVHAEVLDGVGGDDGVVPPPVPVDRLGRRERSASSWPPS